MVPRLAVILMLSLSAGLAQQPKKKSAAKPATTVAAPAKSATTAAQSFAIETINVEGLRNYNAAQVIAASGLKVGDTGDKAKFDAARDKLVASGAFASAGYRYAPGPSGHGFALTFEIVEVEQIYPFRFDDLNAPDAKLREAMSKGDPLFGKKLPGTYQVIDRYAKIIENFLGGKEKIVGRLISEVPGEMVIVFRPDGPPVTIAEVDFKGNNVITTTLLRNTIAGVAIGVPYSEPRFRQLLETSIRPLYDARGRVRVAFGKITVTKSKEVKGLVLLVELTEGESYSLGKVRVIGGGPEDDLLQTANFKTGDMVNFDEIGKGVDRIKRFLQKTGYMKVVAATERKIDDEKKLVDLTVKIEPGPQYVFRKLIVEGLDINSEPEIRKLWAVKMGKPFNGDYPNFFLTRLREDGIFDNLGKTSSRIVVDEKYHEVDVILTFKPAPPKPIEKKPGDFSPAFF
jgi:outer membrane protein insertion porin family